MSSERACVNVLGTANVDHVIPSTRFDLTTLATKHQLVIAQTSLKNHALNTLDDDPVDQGLLRFVGNPQVPDDVLSARAPVGIEGIGPPAAPSGQHLEVAIAEERITDGSTPVVNAFEVRNIDPAGDVVVVQVTGVGPDGVA